jgi:peptidyl-tRNA hydrolase
LLSVIMASAVTDDPYAMYYVVRKDARLTFGQAMDIAGAAAVRCVHELGSDAHFADAFAAWHDRARKVALRASAEEMEQVRAETPCAVQGDELLCLPPMRKSERSPLLEALRPFTDAPRPKEPPPEPENPKLVYVVQPGVIKTMGKAMAQAGHAATAADEELGIAVTPAIVRAATPEQWEALKARDDSVVVTDGGHTQVAPGTETVVALAPGDAVGDLSAVP